MRALERSRARRFATAGELQLALDEISQQLHLATSPIVRARFLQDLFARKLAAWRAAEEAGRSLGQHLASLPETDVLGSDEETGGGGTEPASLAGTRGEQPRGTGTQPGPLSSSPLSTEGARQGRPRRLALGFMAGALAVLGALALGARAWLESETATQPEPTASAAGPGVSGEVSPFPRPASELVPLAAKVAAIPSGPGAAADAGATGAHLGGAAGARPSRPLATRKQAPARRSGTGKQESPAPANAASGARVKIWDPDSVLLPK
jgi:hypothetical protein